MQIVSLSTDLKHWTTVHPIWWR